MTRFPFILLLIVLLAAAGCERHDAALEARVHEAYLLADVSPDSAIAILDSLAPRALTAPRASRARHALATVKARDKAFITHSSDTTILPLIDYYSRRPASDTLRPVALYYAGRVYADMGDAPRALDFLQQALDALPTNKNPRLQSCIHAQRGEIYYLAGFLKEALRENKKALDTSILLNDSLFIIEDLITLGYGYQANDMYDSALIYYRKAYDMTVLMNIDYKKSIILGDMALAYHQLGVSSLADSIIHEALRYPVPPRSKSPLYSIASEIINDYNSPYYYHLAKWRCDSGSVYAKYGANIDMALLDISKNSLDSARYHIITAQILYDSIRNIGSTEAIARMKAVYDYSIHERESSLLKAEKSTLKWQLAFIAILLISIIIIASWYIIRLRQQNRKFRELEKLYKNNENFSAAIRIQEEDISALPIVKTFKEKSEAGIPVSDEEWSELDDLIRTHYPKLYLALKVNNVLSLVEWRVTMLIKIDIQPSKISNLINRSKNSVSSIRTRLNKKLNGGSGSSKDWDAFVRSL